MITFEYISFVSFTPKYPIRIHEIYRGYSGPRFYSDRALVNFQVILDHPFLPFCLYNCDGYECFEDKSNIVEKLISKTDDGKDLMYPVKAFFYKYQQEKAILVSDLLSFKNRKVWIPLEIADAWVNFKFQQVIDF